MSIEWCGCKSSTLIVPADYLPPIQDLYSGREVTPASRLTAKVTRHVICSPMNFVRASYQFKLVGYILTPNSKVHVMTTLMTFRDLASLLCKADSSSSSLLL